MDFDLPDGVAILERTPRVFRAMLDGLPPAWIDATEGPETWSPYVIVGHLIHGEKTDWIPRAQIILAQGTDRRVTPYDPFAQFRERQGKSLADPDPRNPVAPPGQTPFLAPSPPPTPPPHPHPATYHPTPT